MTVQRAEVLAHRVHAQQLDREGPTGSATSAAIMDLGVQDTGRDGASWALANRGFAVAGPTALAEDQEVALVWTLRGAPHFYRRSDLPAVMAATSPFSEADAAKRIFDASRPLRAAGIPVLDALGVIAREQRSIVTKARSKGEVSRLLAERLDPPYLRDCAVCSAVHAYENPFRMAALYGGLELVPGTSPPELRRIPDWPRRVGGPGDPTTAPERLQPVRRYLELLGPATPQTVAAYLDAPVATVKDAWPDDAIGVIVDGERRWQLGALRPTDDHELVRLLGPFDLFLQGRDRELLVPDRQHHKALWPSIGRPGAVLVGTEIVGTWRPRAAGHQLTVVSERWSSGNRRTAQAIGVQAERLASHRGLTLFAVEG